PAMAAARAPTTNMDARMSSVGDDLSLSPPGERAGVRGHIWSAGVRGSRELDSIVLRLVDETQCRIVQAAQLLFVRLEPREFDQITFVQKGRQTLFLLRRKQRRLLQVQKEFLGRALRCAKVEALFQINAQRI